MAKPAPFRVNQDTHVLELALGKFIEGMSAALPPLIAYVNDPLRNHPKWGKLMPYGVPSFAEASPGHIVRPDIMMSGDKKVRLVVGELDFVPSGRGFVCDALDAATRREFLRAFADWYKSMGHFPVLYSTGTVTVCKEEAAYFASCLQQEFDVDIASVNVDEVAELPKGALVDRLFYRSELRRPFDDRGLHVATAEPWLDSKMIFAVVHDPAMTQELKRELGAENLMFLRSALAETYLVEDIVGRPATNVALLQQIVDRNDWILKPTEVEGESNWGSRGVMIGSRFSQKQWAEALERPDRAKKPLGEHPIVQRMAPSRDFSRHWNAVVAGEVRMASAEHFGKQSSEETRRSAVRPVHARLGPYFLVSNTTSEVFVPPAGIITMRQDPLAHGAGDAQMGAFHIT